MKSCNSSKIANQNNNQSHTLPFNAKAISFPIFATSIALPFLSSCINLSSQRSLELSVLWKWNGDSDVTEA
jgi:hypothetical protein